MLELLSTALVHAAVLMLGFLNAALVYAVKEIKNVIGFLLFGKPDWIEVCVKLALEESNLRKQKVTIAISTEIVPLGEKFRLSIIAVPATNN